MFAGQSIRSETAYDDGVAYKELNESPRVYMQRLCAPAIGLPFIRNVLHDTVEADAFGILRKNSDNMATDGLTIETDSIPRWNRELVWSFRANRNAPEASSHAGDAFKSTDLFSRRQRKSIRALRDLHPPPELKQDDHSPNLPLHRDAFPAHSPARRAENEFQGSATTAKVPVIDGGPRGGRRRPRRSLQSSEFTEF
jgi:hypothetical protein